MMASRHMFGAVQRRAFSASAKQVWSFNFPKSTHWPHLDGCWKVDCWLLRPRKSVCLAVLVVLASHCRCWWSLTRGLPNLHCTISKAAQVRKASLCVRIEAHNQLGVAADISHINTKSTVKGYQPDADGLKQCLAGSEIVLIPAGVPRKPGMTRDGIWRQLSWQVVIDVKAF